MRAPEFYRSNINTGSSSSSSCASTTSSSGSSGSSSGSSSGGSGGDHWVYRMPDFNFRNGNVTATAPIPPPAKTSAEPSSKPSSTVKSPATTAAPKVNAGKPPPSFGIKCAFNKIAQSRFASVVPDGDPVKSWAISTGCGLPQQWSELLGVFEKKTPLGQKLSTNCLFFPVNESNFSRNSGKYATLPAKKSSDAIMDVTVDHYSGVLASSEFSVS